MKIKGLTKTVATLNLMINDTLVNLYSTDWDNPKKNALYNNTLNLLNEALDALNKIFTLKLK